jgi:hypothetical protein
MTPETGGPCAPTHANTGQNRHGCSQTPSYGGRPRKVNKRRTIYPNLSPTRPPAVEADAKLWPAWTDLPALALVPEVDGNGRPLARWGVAP